MLQTFFPFRGSTQDLDENVTPHVADKAKHSMIDGRTTRQSGYSISQRVRKRVEEIFGWAKTVGGFRRTRFKGKARTQLAAYVVGAAYNLTRMSRRLAAPASPQPAAKTASGTGGNGNGNGAARC